MMFALGAHKKIDDGEGSVSIVSFGGGGVPIRALSVSLVLSRGATDGGRLSLGQAVYRGWHLLVFCVSSNLPPTALPSLDSSEAQGLETVLSYAMYVNPVMGWV